MVFTEQIIGTYATKYKSLIPLINETYSKANSDIINIFIDVGSIVRNITSQDCSNSNGYLIASKIINLCAHYRNFFREYYKTYSKFFLILSNIDNKSINKLYIPAYIKEIYSSNNIKINSDVNNAISILKILIPYIDDFYWCESNYEFGVHVYDIITYELSKENKCIPGLVITKDAYNFQLVSESNPIVNVLRPKKYKGDDTSFIVTSDNAIKHLSLSIGSSYIESNIDSSLMTLIGSLSKMPDRGIKSIHRLSTVIKALDQAIKNGHIINNRTVDIQYICDILTDNKLMKINDPMLILNRFKGIDIISQHGVFSNLPITMRYNGMVNLYDPKTVREINNEYFKDYPLDLNVL